MAQNGKRFHKTRGISRLVEEISGSQNSHFCMLLVKCCNDIGIVLR